MEKLGFWHIREILSSISWWWQPNRKWGPNSTRFETYWWSLRQIPPSLPRVKWGLPPEGQNLWPTNGFSLSRKKKTCGFGACWSPQVYISIFSWWTMILLGVFSDAVHRLQMKLFWIPLHDSFFWPVIIHGLNECSCSKCSDLLVIPPSSPDHLEDHHCGKYLQFDPKKNRGTAEFIAVFDCFGGILPTSSNFYNYIFLGSPSWHGSLCKQIAVSFGHHPSKPKEIFIMPTSCDWRIFVAKSCRIFFPHLEMIVRVDSILLDQDCLNFLHACRVHEFPISFVYRNSILVVQISST